MACMVSTTEPAFQTVPVGYLGSTFEPRSPNLANFVLVNSPCPGVGVGAPPAIPHASYTGAFPGALHGFHRVQSSAEPAVTLRFKVRYFASLSVAFMPLPQRS